MLAPARRSAPRLLAALTLSALPVAAQDQALPHVLTLEWGGLEAVLANPRDAGLLEGVRLGARRLVELAAASPGDAPPPEVVQFVADVLEKPLRLRVGLAEETFANPPVSFRLEVSGEREFVDALGLRFPALFGEDGGETPDAGPTGLWHLPLPGGGIDFGVPTEGPPRFVIAFGEVTGGTPPAASPNETPALALELDLGSARALLSQGLSQGGSDERAIHDVLAGMGFFADGPFALDLQLTHVEGGAAFELRLRAPKEMMDAMGAGAGEPLASSELSRLPRAATYAQLTRSEPLTALRTVQALLASEMPAEQNPFELFRTMTGLDLETDLVEPLGDVSGLYFTSASGGGLGSLVMLSSVDDGERLASSLESLASLATAMLAAEADGRVRLERWDPVGLDEAVGFRVVFPALPIPMAPVVLLHDGWLYAAPFADNAIDAARQAASGQSLLDAPGFRAAFAALGEGPFHGLQYSDTAAHLQDYYVALRMLGELFDNLLLPLDANQPQMSRSTVPSFQALRDGARPTLSVTRFTEDEVLVRGSMDGSVLANASGIAGFYSGAFLVGVAMSAVSPAMLSMAAAEAEMGFEPEVWETGGPLMDALQQYALQNDGRWPKSLDELTTPDANGARYLDQLPADPWGHPFRYEAPTEDRPWPRLYSTGADGLEGGVGAAADVELF